MAYPTKAYNFISVSVGGSSPLAPVGTMVEINVAANQKAGIKRSSTEAQGFQASV